MEISCCHGVVKTIGMKPIMGKLHYLLRAPRVKIKTVTSKEYDFKGEKKVFYQLVELFPFKIKRNKKTLGNNG